MRTEFLRITCPTPNPPELCPDTNSIYPALDLPKTDQKRGVVKNTERHLFLVALLCKTKATDQDDSSGPGYGWETHFSSERSES